MLHTVGSIGGTDVATTATVELGAMAAETDAEAITESWWEASDETTGEGTAVWETTGLPPLVLPPEFSLFSLVSLAGGGESVVGKTAKMEKIELISRKARWREREGEGRREREEEEEEKEEEEENETEGE